MNKLHAKTSQLVSKVYSDNTIADKSFNGSHNDQSFEEIAKTIFENPDIQHEHDDKTGITSMKLNDKMIGWYDRDRGIGDIDQNAYDKIRADAAVRESVSSQPNRQPAHDEHRITDNSNRIAEIDAVSSDNMTDNDFDM